MFGPRASCTTVDTLAELAARLHGGRDGPILACTSIYTRVEHSWPLPCCFRWAWHGARGEQSGVLARLPKAEFYLVERRIFGTVVLGSRFREPRLGDISGSFARQFQNRSRGRRHGRSRCVRVPSWERRVRDRSLGGHRRSLVTAPTCLLPAIRASPAAQCGMHTNGQWDRRTTKATRWQGQSSPRF